MGDSDLDDVPDQVPLEQRAVHPSRRLVLVGVVQGRGRDSDTESTSLGWNPVTNHSHQVTVRRQRRFHSKVFLVRRKL